MGNRSGFRPSDGIDVDESTFARRDPDGTEQYFVVRILNRARATPEHEQRRKYRESESVSPT